MTDKEVKNQEELTALESEEMEEQFPDFHPRQLSVVPFDLEAILKDIS
jgi:hypothetical protein